jgi:energy-converting hydrogenase Eha subunit C
MSTDVGTLFARRQRNSQHRVRIIGLCIFHVASLAVVKLLPVFVSFFDPLFMMVITAITAVFAAQLSILGALTAILHRLPLARMSMLAIGIAGLWTVLTIDGWSNLSLDGLFELAIIVALPAVATFLAVAWMRRARQFSLQPTTLDHLNAQQSDLQFSIRHMFVLTAVVAITMATGRVVQYLLTNPNVRTRFPGRGYDFIEHAVVYVPVAICIAAITVASVWACFGLPHSRRRLLVVFLLTVAVAGVPIYFFQAGDRYHRLYILAGFVMQTVIVNLSFLVLRSCNYRLLPEEGYAAIESKPKAAESPTASAVSKPPPGD